jgi:hypothetical protein
MDNELTQPLGQLSPLYSLGTEFVKGQGGTGHVVTDEDTNVLRLATQIMHNQDVESGRIQPQGITAYQGGPHRVGGEGFIPPSDPRRNQNLARHMEENHPDVPHVVYHGTKLHDEHSDEAGQPFSQFTGHPNWFSSDPYLAEGYSGEEGSIYPTHISLKKPLHIHEFDMNDDASEALPLAKRLGLPNDYVESMGKNHSRAFEIVNHPHFVEAAIKKGFDGIIANEGKYKTFGTFDPTQIKSATGNNGQFDPSNPDITKARGGNVRHGYAADGSVPDDSATTPPISLKDLQDWKKMNPLSLDKHAMDKTFSKRETGFEGAEPIAMPASVQELLEWSRKHHHAAGGGVDHISHALRLARHHFDEGGDVRPDANDVHDVSQPDQKDISDAAIEAGNRQNAIDAQQATADVGRFGFGNDFNAGALSDLGFSPKSPDNLQEYTAQRMNTSYAGVPTDTPYQGTLLDAAMDPSTAFGMGYPALVGKQLSKEGAEALLANLGYESTQNGRVLNPNAISGSGYGLAQWTDPARQKAFFEAMTPAGQLAPQTKEEKRALLGATTAPQQLGYALNEIFGGKYAPTVNAITTPGNLASKVATVEQNYEGAGVPALDKRIALANQIASNTGYGTFAQNTFDQTPTTQYASNIPTPVARPSDLGTVPTASFTQNTPTSTVSNDDPYGMGRYTSAINAMLNALPSDTQSKIANNQLKQNNIPFTGSTEDPELIAQQEKLQQEILMRLARGYASGGGVDSHISHALRLAASMGRGNDTMLAHINPHEAALLKAHGGSGKRNPHTGLIEFDDEAPDTSPDTSTATSTENDKYHDMMNQTGWGSEDPGAIASFNANNAEKGYGLSGPQSTQGELAVGQRTPDTMVPGKDGQMRANFGSQLNDFFGQFTDPKFMGVDNPKYAEMAARKDPNPNVGNTNDHGGGPDQFGQQIIQAAATNAQKAATEAQPIVPYVAPPPFQPTQANVSPPYADFGASQSAISSAYNNPALNNLLKPQQVASATPYYNPYLKPFYASGGKVGNNNALANAMRMVLANKS